MTTEQQLNKTIAAELLAIEKKENSLNLQMSSLQRKFKVLFEYREGIKQLDLQRSIASTDSDSASLVQELRKGAQILFPVIDKSYRYKYNE